jgi:hypothetical protein
MRSLLLILALTLAACRPAPAPTTPAPAPAPPYDPAPRCDGQWARVQAPDGALSALREGLDCGRLAPGAWQCCAIGGQLGCYRPAECRDGVAQPPRWTQPGTRPTSAEVQAFTPWMAAQAHARVFGKRDAPEMQLAAVFLTAAHIQASTEHFLGDSATTIPLPGPDGAIAAIYLPYPLGVASAAWDLDVQMGAIVHEPEHAIEYAEDGPAVMSWRYIASSRWRVEYECRAYAGQRAYLTWRGAVGYPADMFGDNLSDYGVRPEWVAYARALMSMLSTATDRGADTPAAWRIARPWLEAHAPELRGVQVPQ